MSIRNWNGWERLICPYFEATCRCVLGYYLKENGFAEKGLAEKEDSGLTFYRSEIFLDIGYELESVPQTLTMTIGIDNKVYDKKLRPCYIPYWYLLPQDHWAHQAYGRGFRNEAELEALLIRFRDEIINPYAKPLWLNIDYLWKAVTSFWEWWDTHSNCSSPPPPFTPN